MSTAIPTAGVKPADYDEPFGASKSWQMITSASVCMVFSTFWLGLRLWTRSRISRELGPDDYLIAAAWIFATAMCITEMVQCSYGLGTHLWEVDVIKFSTFLQLNMVIGNTYAMALALSKISILAFYLRLFQKKRFRILVYLTAAFVISYTISGIFVVIFTCNPVAASWDLKLMMLPSTKCLNRPKAYLTAAAFNIMSDIFVISLPCREIWKLQLPLRQRLSLIGIFAVGLAVCVISVLRLKSVANLLNSEDITWDTTILLIWSTIEAHATIVCACSPTLKPLFTRFLPNFFRSSLSSGRRKGSSGPYALKQSRDTTGCTYELGSSRKYVDAENGNLTVVGRGAAREGMVTSVSQERILHGASDDEVCVTRTVEIKTGRMADC
ncbi:uncharacterized protein L3040_005832 [Drepanopeziza brunnea f. sp. 'multigermtubi']|uniref:uncharacterized protein n=1 Tax=Drepanopeziza brunnea f. sp. 'multigermtubi' TaxID=698441 RepID=UPI0023972858|nr:hypothetical protein L3040_005832 [Drepanopeziza brunnea f. sp. 'multigermtubi']